MIVCMRTTKAALLSALALSAATSWANAETRANPYGPIVERNAFGLKPPPPPQTETPTEPAKPPPNVKLTGISNLFQKRALLEITEQQPGAKPGQAPTPGGNVNRPILGESEGAFGVEVLAIDLERNIVKIRNAGTESELTFEVPKPSGGAVAGAPGQAPGQPPVVNPQALNVNSAAGSQPTIVSSSAAQATGGGGVSIYGGGNTAAQNNSGGVTSYGGAVPSPLGADTGLRTIPSRTIRTPEQAPVDPAQQQLLMELNRTRQQMQQQGTINNNTRPGTSRRPTVEPPLPPTQFSQPQGQ
jgi:hypothetical protein